VAHSPSPDLTAQGAHACTCPAPHPCSYGLGTVLLEVWAAPDGMGLYSAAEVKAAAATVQRPGSAVPQALQATLVKLLSATPRQRPTFAAVLSNAAAYFGHPLVRALRGTVPVCALPLTSPPLCPLPPPLQVGALLFIDELALKEPADKVR
jgi:hypothetical protein